MSKSPVYVSVSQALLPIKSSFSSYQHLPTVIIDFLRHLFEACIAHGEPCPAFPGYSRIPRSTLKHYIGTQTGPSCSESLISMRLTMLAEKGVLEKSPGSANYRFTGLENLTLWSIENRNKSSDEDNIIKISRKEINQQKEMLKQSESEEFLYPDASVSHGYIEGLINGILDSAIRISCKDKRRVIRTNYVFNIRDDSGRRKERIDILTQCLSREDSEIMMLSDLRIIHVLNTMFIAHMARRRDAGISKIRNEFKFDIKDLCEEMGLHASNANKKVVRKMLLRVKDTSFEIDAEQSQWFQEKYAGGCDRMEYRYITEWYARTENEIDIVDDVELVERSERFYVIKFHESVFNALTKRTTVFVSHLELAREKLGLAHRFNSYGRIRIGVTARPIAKCEYFLDDLHDQVMKSARKDNFCRDFIAMVIKFSEHPVQDDEVSIRARIYGYIVTCTRDKLSILREMKARNKRRRPGGKIYPLISIERDPNDIIVGNESTHNRLLRKEFSDLVYGVA